MPEDYINFDAFLDMLRSKADNPTEQGRKFEEAMVTLLPNLPDYNFDAAWRWKEWPSREEVTGHNAQDIGIDIVARTRDTHEYWAVQCKFYDPKNDISLKDLGTFYAVSGHEGFAGRLIISTTDKWSKHAETAIIGQEKETKRLRLQDLRAYNIKWHWLNPHNTEIIPEEKTLYPLQNDALVAAKTHFSEHERGQLIMACGTGKTFTSLKIAEDLVPPSGSVLFCLPSLSLMKQTITEWATQRTRDHRYLAICSDPTVGHQDESVTKLADISVPVSTDPKIIATKLHAHISAAQNTVTDTDKAPMTVVFSTYQSLPSLSHAQADGGGETLSL